MIGSRILPLRPLVALLMVILLGCQASEGASERIMGDNFFPGDASIPVEPEPDAGVDQPGLSGGYQGQAEGIPASQPDRNGSASSLDDDYETSDPTCYDGVDTDGNGAMDCLDPRCHAEASCCVSSGDCCAPSREPGFLPRIDFEECEDVRACLGDEWMTFGAPSTWEGAFFPGIVQSVSSGVHSTEALNLEGMRVSVGVDFLFPDTCGASCMETASVALTAQSALNMHEEVTPIVALVASGSRREVRLVIRHETVAAWRVESSDDSWQLTLKPNGLLSVSLGGHPLLTDQPYPTANQVRVAVYGRNRARPSPANPPESGVMGIQALRFETSRCDIATSWAPPQSIQIEGPELSPTVESVTFARHPEEPRRAVLAVEDARRIQVLQRTTDHWSPPASAIAASIEPATPFDMGGIEDPELIWGPDRLHLYYTAVSVMGVRTIGLATTPSSLDAHWEREVAPVITTATDREFLTHESPSVVLHHSGTWVMMTLATRADGSQAMPVYTSEDGVHWERLVGAGFPHLEEDTVFKGPDLSLHANVWYVHMARRRGARWRLDAAASDQLVFWRSLGEVMHPRLVGSALAVMEPDLEWQPGQLEVRFIARSSNGRQLLTTRRISAADGAFLE